ncbi:MAG: peptide chain release factor N(5)-glutamine methyltransferase [Azoarcus sp.]|jgi:release factor glutamine methyltransferase|nr:peptide chain release factor N(5)-glutamine methyltransferase [Azoarcus sp.]
MRMNAPPATDIGGALAWARKRIPPSEARLLLRHVCHQPAAHLAAWPEEVLPTAAWNAFRALVERRAAGEPVAYLTGEREFYGRVFKVSPKVLIPRPETELLVELALAHYAAAPGVKALDLGTGSGVLAITLALELARPRIVAVDCSREALEVAAANAVRLAANVSFLCGNWFVGLGREQFDLIVANPPYVAEDDPHLVMGDLRFEPRRGLAASRGGLSELASIIADAGGHLETGGRIFMEHGYDQAAAVRGLLTDAGFADIASWRDMAGIERVSGGRWTG